MLLDTPLSYEKVSDGCSVIAIFDGAGVARFNIITTKNFQPGSQGEPQLSMRQFVKPSEFLGQSPSSTTNERTTMLACMHKTLLDGQQVTVVVRKNQQADIYWNCKFIDSTEQAVPDENQYCTYSLVDVNFHGAILKCKVTKTERGSIVTKDEFRLLSFQQRQRTRFVHATILPDFVEKEGDQPSMQMDFFKNLQFGKFVSPF